MDTVVTGHSLGGAAALLVGLYWYTETPQRHHVLAVYTFGQPRVFDNRGATSWPDFAHRVYRYENCLDFVPLIPTGDSFSNSFFVSFLGNQEASDYEHLGESILLMNNGRYWAPGSTDIDRDRTADIKAALAAVHAKKPIDHSIDDYIARLEGVFGAAASPTAVNPAGQFGGVCAPILPGV
jgi:hypothetical protein